MRALAVHSPALPFHWPACELYQGVTGGLHCIILNYEAWPCYYKDTISLNNLSLAEKQPVRKNSPLTRIQYLREVPGFRSAGHIWYKCSEWNINVSTSLSSTEVQGERVSEPHTSEVIFHIYGIRHSVCFECCNLTWRKKDFHTTWQIGWTQKAAEILLQPIKGEWGNEQCWQGQTSKSRKVKKAEEIGADDLLRLPIKEMRIHQRERLAAETTADKDARL